MFVYIENRVRSSTHRPPSRKISITDILPDTKSREEQDGANHFSIQSRMAELWPNLCGDVGENGEEGPFLLL